MQFSSKMHSTDRHSSSSSETCSTFDRSKCVVPPLDLTKLKQKTNKTSADKRGYCSPFVTKSEFAYHAPTPGIIENVDSERVNANMLKYLDADKVELHDVFDTLVNKAGDKNRDVIDNNLLLYRQDMDREHYFWENRVGRQEKQQLSKDIIQRQWYIRKSEKEMYYLEQKLKDNMQENRLLKQGSDELKKEIRNLEVEVKDAIHRKGMSTEKIKEALNLLQDESGRIGRENEYTDVRLSCIEKRLNKYQRNMSEKNKHMNGVQELQLTDKALSRKKCKHESENLIKMSECVGHEVRTGDIDNVSSRLKLPCLNKKKNKDGKINLDQYSEPKYNAKLPQIQSGIKVSTDKLFPYDDRDHVNKNTARIVLPPIQHNPQLVSDGTVFPLDSLQDSKRCKSKKTNAEKQAQRVKPRKPTKLPPVT